MTHETSRLQAYLDGELAPAQARRVHDHLQACQACRDELAALERTWAALAAGAAPLLKRPLWPEVSARLATRRPRARFVWMRAGLATAAVVAGLLLGLQLDRVLEQGNPRATNAVATMSSDNDAYLQDVTPLDEIWWSAGTATGTTEVGS